MSSGAASYGSLDLPLYGAGPSQSFSRFFRKYATFSGRASRSEFWWVFLISTLVSVACGLVSVVAVGGFTRASDDATDLGDVLGYIWSVVTLIPSLAVSWRRLHDTDRSGRWNLLWLVPVLGWVVVLVLSAARSNRAGVRFDR